MSRIPITIEVLEVLDAIDRRGSFAKAAEELNKATSAISYAVQKLEEQLAITLFERQGRRSVLTPAGKLLLQEGRGILNATSRLARKAQELATGWETHLRVALESVAPHEQFFAVLEEFLKEFPSIEMDISECVLNGGWEALEQDRVDLLVGAPGPVPAQKGFRAVSIGKSELLPVISAQHPQARHARNPATLATLLPQLRRVITHDTSMVDISRSAGLSNDGQRLFVQTIDQKLQAILSGAGVGHLPKSRIEACLSNGELIALDIASDNDIDAFLAWRISNKGKALKALTQKLSKVF